MALILLVLGLMNSLNNEMEGYKFAFLFIGIFLAPMICQLIWLITSIIVSKGLNKVNRCNQLVLGIFNDYSQHFLIIWDIKKQFVLHN